MIEVTMYVFEGDRMVKAYKDTLHDTLFNVSTIHVPNMLRYVGRTLTQGQDIRQVIIEVKDE